MEAESDCGIFLEILDSSEVPEHELKDFKETIPLKLEDVVQQGATSTALSKESEEDLITKYMKGETDFPDLYTTFDTSEDAEESKEQKNRQEECSYFSDNLETKKDKKPHRKKSQLSAALQGLMGEANLCFVRGQVEMAEKICLEIIRQNPLAAEPFFTLAQLYETKHPEKFLQFSTIAAHLDPMNRDQWIRIADLNIQKGNLQQTRIIYSKAIAYNSRDYDLRLRKAKVLTMMNEHREAMLTYLKVIPMLPQDKGEFCLITAKNVARYFHSQNKPILALQAMQGAYVLVPQLFSTEDLNLYLELLVMNKNYSTVLDVMQKHCGIDLLKEQDGEEIIVGACSMPDELIPDFRVKLCVSLIHLKAVDLFKYIVNNVIEFIPIESGVDWYMDIAEALMNEEHHAEAMDLLRPAVTNEAFCPPAYVWLKYAECNRALDNLDQAIVAYYQVIELAPYCFDAKFTLSTLLKQRGRHKEAIEALEQNLDGDSVDPRLMYERCLMLKTYGDIDQYMELGYFLIARNSIKLQTREEVLVVANNAYNCKLSNLKSITEQRQDDRTNCNESDTSLSFDDEYNLFIDLAETMYKYSKFGLLQKLCFAMVTTRKFRPKIRDLAKILALASYCNGDTTVAFNAFRETLSKNLRNNCYWNLSNVITQKTDNSNYYRYLKRLFARQRCQAFLKIFLGNYHLSAGSYKYALSVYAGIFKENKDPLVALLISVVFTQLAIQKNMFRKTTAFSQAIAFIKTYCSLRLSPIVKQEVFYNMGRLFHQISLFHLALYWYKQAMDVPSDIFGEDIEILDLRAETAYNIHLMYKASGNKDMARKYLQEIII